MKDSVGLSEFKIPLNKLAPLETFRTRGGDKLHYRLYPSWNERLLVLYHGVGGDSRYFAPLAALIAANGWANVVTPDLRAHGVSAHPETALAVKNAQLEEDFDELLIHLKFHKAFDRIIVGGHSLGGGLALKILCSPYASAVHGGLLFAPMVPPPEKIAQPQFGGWIEWRDGLLQVGMPEAYRTGNEVLSYDPAFIAAALPADTWPELWREQNKRRPELRLRVLMGSQDQVLNPAALAARFQGLPGVEFHETTASHLGVVLPKAAGPWVKSLVEHGGLFG